MASRKVVLEKKVVERLKKLRKKARRKKKPFRGKWELSSDSNHHWNAKGTSEIGGDRVPDEVQAKIEELKEKFGKPPDDLRWTYRLE